MKTKCSPEMKTKKTETRGGVQTRNRIKYTALQLQRLEKAFMSTQYPDTATLEDLSSTLTVSIERLAIWFQNRRSKFKRQSKDGHVNWMRQQIYRKDNQSRDSSSQQTASTCHVLSAPSQNSTHQPQQTQSSYVPSSNLHYLPSVQTPCSRLTENDYGMMTSSPPTTNENYCYTANMIPSPTEYSDAVISPYELQDQQSYWSQQHYGYYPQSGYHVDSQYYQSYLPYYNYSSNYPQVGV